MSIQSGPTNRREHVIIAPIQYLRGIAAMMVVWYHSIPKAPGFEDLIGPSGYGANGVNIFFVISGFIMWVTTAGKSVTPQDFIVRRIIRVVPLYWLMTFVMIACSLIPGMLAKLRLSETAIVQSLLFIPYDSLSFPGHAWPVLEPGWTLNYEMFFYTLFALSLALPLRRRLVGLVGLIWTLTAIGIVFGPFKNPIAMTYTDLPLVQFAAGMIVADLWVRGTIRIGLIASLVSMMLGFCMLAIESDFSHISGAILIVIGSLDPVISTLKSRLLLALGNASYSIYLTHMFVLGAMGVLWRHLFASISLASAILFFSLSLILCAFLGWISYRLIEQPITRRLNRIARSIRTADLQSA